MNDRSTSRAARIACVALISVMLASCAGPQHVRTEVTTFNEWSTLPADKTYAFARTLEYQNSLEVKGYEDIVRDELALQGFRLSPDLAQANLVVTLRPSVSSTRLRGRDPWPIDPFWAPYGFYGGRNFGWYGPYWSSFYNFNAYDFDVFRRRLELDIDSKSTAGKRYYEGRVENTGDNASMTTVMRYLVRALFTDFPGNNGQTRRVDVPLSER